MSFDLGPIKRPMIQESQNMQNNGGGGNLGYMAQGDGEESEEELYEEENTHLLEQYYIQHLQTPSQAFRNLRKTKKYQIGYWLSVTKIPINI